MFLGGLWHGASWNFVLWGLMHGAYLAVHRVVSDRFPFLGSSRFFKSGIGKIVSIGVMQYFVFLAWIPFRVENIHEMMYAMEKYVFLEIHFNILKIFLSSHKLDILLIFGFVILHFISYKTNIIEKISKMKIQWWAIILLMILSSIIFFYDGNPEDFVYFRF